nr:MAG TPA: hypothetical protein [Caudoviricetes sp.]
MGTNRTQLKTNFPTWEKWFRTLTSTVELDR